MDESLSDEMHKHSSMVDGCHVIYFDKAVELINDKVKKLKEAFSHVQDDVINKTFGEEKLKTLKDLKEKIIEILREAKCPNPKATAEFIIELFGTEAVKWFKKKLDSGDDCCCTCEEVWREFLNITEEDLKGGKRDGN